VLDSSLVAIPFPTQQLWFLECLLVLESRLVGDMDECIYPALPSKLDNRDPSCILSLLDSTIPELTEMSLVTS